MSRMPPLIVPGLKGPRVERSIKLEFMGDWGQMNLHRVCCWLAMEVADRCGSDTRTAIWNGRGGADAVLAVARGEVDAAMTTPAHYAGMALKGVGPYAGEGFSHLRALGNVPQNDRLVLALKSDLGISSFADLREKKPALKIVTSPDDGVNMIGFAVQRFMEAAGISQAEFESWGGEYILSERPHQCFDAMLAGEADGIFHEAIMAKPWQDIANSIDLTFLPFEEEVLTKVQADYGMQRNTLAKGYFRNHDEDIQVLDFSDFLLVVREDMPEDIAHLMTWCLCETRQVIEQQYQHVPPERSPISYPLVPENMSQSVLPLHEGAQRYYQEAGILTKQA